MKRLLMVLALAGFAAACGDDDDDSSPGDGGGGGNDSGIRDGGLDGGPRDSGMDAATTITCGTMTCDGHTIMNVGFLAPMCTRNFRDAEVCGVSTALLGGVDAGYPPVVQENAPGVASTSCTSFFDSQETGDAGRGNGRIDTTVYVGALMMSIPITYPGCCTERGFCSVDTNMGMTSFGASNAGLGCLESTVAFRGQAPAAQMVPCNTSSGMIMLPDGGM